MKESVIKRTRMLALLAMAGVFAGMTGCASTSDLDSLRAKVDAAASDAQTAQADAAAASRDAADAKAMAQSAMDTANDAKVTADDAQSKIDRMFKKAMYK